MCNADNENRDVEVYYDEKDLSDSGDCKIVKALPPIVMNNINGVKYCGR